MKRPKFSIIAVDYEHHVPRLGMKKGIESIANQTFKDFELIICHDGPKEIPYEEEINFSELGLDPVITNTESKHALWGHPSRDAAMRIAKGEYFLQFNIDNLLKPECLETIAKKINENENIKIFIFSILHWKLGGINFSGIPPVLCNIDALQLVAHRDIWKENNYWNNYENWSDGIIYENLCRSNSWIHIPEILGENF